MAQKIKVTNFKFTIFTFILLLFVLGTPSLLMAEDKLTIETQSMVLTGVETEIQVMQSSIKSSQPVHYKITQGNHTIKSGVITPALSYSFKFTLNKSGLNNLKLQIGDESTEFQIKTLAGILTLLPPVVVIILSIITKQIFIPLLIGIFFATLILYDFNLFTALCKTFDTHLIFANQQQSHSILTLLLLGSLLAPLLFIIKKQIQPTLNRKKSLTLTLGLTLTLFFNHLISIFTIGTLASPLKKKNKISKQVFSYVINIASTTIASLFIFATILSLNYNLLQSTLGSLPTTNFSLNQALIQITPFKFYSILTLFFMVFVILSGKNFGPMLSNQTQKSPQGGTQNKGKLKPLFSLLGISLLISIFLLSAQAYQSPTPSKSCLLTTSFKSYPIAIFALTLICFFIAHLRKIPLQKVQNLWLLGFKNTAFIVATLILAWTFSNLTMQINCPSYLASIINKSIPHWLLPTIFFIISFAIAVLTGSMQVSAAILIPIILPIVYHQNLQYFNLELAKLANPPLLFHFIKQAILLNLAACFEGTLFGIHCSPIAPNSILMAQVAKINIIKLLKAQIPYAFLIGFITIVFCYLPAGLGISPYLLLAITFLIIATFLLAFGKSAGEALVPAQGTDQPRSLENEPNKTI